MTMRIQEKPSESSSITPHPVEKPSESPSMTVRIIEKPSESSSQSLSPSVSSSMTMRIQEKPSQSPVCGKWICKEPLTYEFLEGRDICIDRVKPTNCLRYDADGQCIEVAQEPTCPEKYVLLNGMCVYIEPAIWQGCSVTPVPVKSQELVKTPIKYVNGTITIEIASNVTTNTTAFEDPAVIDRLREAIAALYGINPSQVVINNIQWIQQGTFMASFIIPTARRLVDLANGFIIDYTIVDTNGKPIDATTQQIDDSRLSTASTMFSSVLGTNAIVRAPGQQTAKPKAATDSSMSIGGIVGVVMVSLLVVAGLTAGGVMLKKRALKASQITKVTKIAEETFNPHYGKKGEAQQQNQKRFSVTKISMPNFIVESFKNVIPSSGLTTRAPLTNFSKNAIMTNFSTDKKWESTTNVLFKHPKNKVEMSPTYAAESV